YMTLGAEEDDAVPAMKLTPNAAMRARDVSRPRAEHLAEAEAAEVRGSPGRESPGWGGPAPDSAERGRAERGRAERGRTEQGRAEAGGAETGEATAAVTGDDPAGQPGFPRRRRGPRDGGRRGRSSR
ncbi:MAG: hypothetical protein ACLP8X_30570, partial [Streptosporangiaceae bacterium]